MYCVPFRLFFDQDFPPQCVQDWRDLCKCAEEGLEIRPRPTACPRHHQVQKFVQALCMYTLGLLDSMSTRRSSHYLLTSLPHINCSVISFLLI